MDALQKIRLTFYQNLKEIISELDLGPLRESFTGPRYREPVFDIWDAVNGQHVSPDTLAEESEITPEEIEEVWLDILTKIWHSTGNEEIFENQYAEIHQMR